MQKRTKNIKLNLILFLLCFILLFSSFAVLPACSVERYTVEYYAGTGGHIDGKKVQKVRMGRKTSSVKAVANVGYKFIGWSDGVTSSSRTDDKSYGGMTVQAYFDIDELSLPVIVIDTEDSKPILDKENYIACSVTVQNTEEQYMFAGKEAKIKGRGNSTWKMFDKKPYKLKFGEKADLFGNGSAKAWTLIANYSDKSLLRNKIAYALGDAMGLEYTNQCRSVELYLNGEYMGVYLVCEQTETGKTRVNVNDDINPEDQGFLVELDWHIIEEDGTEGLDWFYIDGTPYAIKGPETDEDGYTGEATEAIRQYLTKCYNAVKVSSYRDIVELIDVESFAKTYIINELLKNKDVGESSWYIYRDRGGKLFSGPLWDFDLSLGNTSYHVNDGDKTRKPDRLWASESNVWYKLLLKHDGFKALVSALLHEYGQAILDAADNVVNEARACTDSYTRNFDRWKILGKYVWPNPFDIWKLRTWDKQVDYCTDFLNQSMDYLLSVYK